MAQEKEIEKKNLLTAEEFKQLCQTFQIHPEDFYWQANTYFDTPDFQLKAKRSALRIRKKEGQYELTLKQPAKECLIETNQQLDVSEADYIITTGRLPEGEVKSALTIHIGDEKITALGTLQTKRAETPYKTGTLFLDHSLYLNTEDYEIEIEGERMATVHDMLDEILQTHNIPYRSTPNKIQRFFTKKQQENN